LLLDNERKFRRIVHNGSFGIDAGCVRNRFHCVSVLESDGGLHTNCTLSYVLSNFATKRTTDFFTHKRPEPSNHSKADETANQGTNKGADKGANEKAHQTADQGTDKGADKGSNEEADQSAN
jgi:hypothetical protein